MKIKKTIAAIGLALLMAVPVSAENLGTMSRMIAVDATAIRNEAKICSLKSNSSLEPYGLQCTLFGHKYQASYFDTITHRVRTQKPRCKKGTYKNEVCSVCNDSVATLISEKFIDCCD